MALRPQAGNARHADRGAAWIIYALIIALLIPVSVEVAGLRLTPGRIVILLMTVPAILTWAMGRAGRVIVPDFLILAFGAWHLLSVVANHGASELERAGMTVAELIGPYFMARAYLRTQAEFLGLVRFLLYVIIVLAILSGIESTTGRRLLDPISIGVDQGIITERRFGLIRARVMFEHAILYGVFCALTVPLFYYYPKPGAAGSAKRGYKGLLWAWAGILAAIFSLSMGAYLMLMVSALLIGWNMILRAVRSRWWILAILSAVAYAVIEIGSNRSFFEVFIQYFSFNYGNAYWRIIIFIEGIQNVWDNPLFGLGYRDWVRPDWMHSASVDNFWLLAAMQNGIPGFLLLASFYGTVLAFLIRIPLTDPVPRRIREGLLISLVALVAAAGTVHFWGIVQVFAFVLLGAGSWLAQTESATAGMKGETERQPQAARGAVRYSRYAPKPKHATSVGSSGRAM